MASWNWTEPSGYSQNTPSMTQNGPTTGHEANEWFLDMMHEHEELEVETDVIRERPVTFCSETVRWVTTGSDRSCGREYCALTGPYLPTPTRQIRPAGVLCQGVRPEAESPPQHFGAYQPECRQDVSL